MRGISNCTVNRISIYISLLMKIANLGNENGGRLIEYTVNRSPVNRGFTVLQMNKITHLVTSYVMGRSHDKLGTS